MGLLPFPAHVRYAIPVFISAAGPSRSPGGPQPAQRAAVEFGVAPAGQGGGEDGPLLVIAGAGSGKTNTLAHRVAHLILNGADPQRMLLLTFSRRAALEMERRVGAVLHRVMRLHAAQQPPALPWAGTFHAIGARLLRDCAPRIGLSESFTILDRGDAEDLMGMVRHELGQSSAKSRFPLKGTCLAIYSRVINSQAPVEDVLKTAFPWCAQWEAELKALFRAYVAAKQDQQALDYDDLLLYWAEMMSDPGIAADVGALRPCAGRRVPGHQSPAIRHPAGHEAGRARPDRGGRRRAVDLFLPRGHRAQHPGLSHAVSEAGARGHAGPQLPFHPAHPERVQRRDRIGGGALCQDLWTDRQSSQLPEMVNVSDEAGQARWVADQVLAQREAGATLKSQAALFRSASHSAALELELTRRNIPFVKFGGLRFLEAAHIKDLLSLLRWAENPRGRMAGFRVAQLLPGVGPATAGKLMDAMSASAEPLAALRAFKPGAAAQQDWGAFADTYAARSRAEMARRRGPGLALVCGPARTAVRRCARAPRRPGTAGPHRGRLSVARTLPDRADARSSRRHQRRIGRAAARTT